MRTLDALYLWIDTIIDRHELASIFSYNLPFIPTTGTLYQSIPCIMLIKDSQSSHVISDGERRKRPSKFTIIRVWSLMKGWGSSVDLLPWQAVYPLHVINIQSQICPGATTRNVLIGCLGGGRTGRSGKLFSRRGRIR